jgi:pSer/pThr/pTyr-binding forkhead associated (FHA) protein
MEGGAAMSKPGEPQQTSSIAQRLAGLRPQEPPQPQPTIFLVAERGPDTGRSYAVDGAGATIGRQAGNTIIPNDLRLSRQHARIEAQAGGFVVRDLGSTNGTLLNGQPLLELQPLRTGDVLQMGSTVFRVADSLPEGQVPTISRSPTTSRLKATTSRIAPPERPALKDGGIIRTPWHERGASSQPVYELRRGRLYRTPWHELGPSQFPEYEVRGTFIYRTAHHEHGASRTPDFELRDGFLYRTGWHERGAHRQPDYQLD